MGIFWGSYDFPDYPSTLLTISLIISSAASSPMESRMLVSSTSIFCLCRGVKLPKMVLAG